MKLKKPCAGILSVLFFILFSSISYAQLYAQETGITPMRLTPDEAVELALRHNLSLESARINLSTRKRASDMSWNQFIPSMTVSGTLNRDNQASTVSGILPIDFATIINPILGDLNQYFQGFPGFPVIPGMPAGMIYGVYPYSVDAPQWRVIGNIQTSLTISAAMFENVNRLRLDYETGILSYEKARLQLERDIRKEYHNILLLQENIMLIRGSFENVDRQVQMAQANYNAGLVPELTLLQARVARENMRPVIEQAENGLKLLMARFSMLLGMSYDTLFELVPITNTIDFIPLDIADMISRAAVGKPDIQELRHTILMMESARRMQQLALTPSLSLSWNSTSAFIRDPWKDSWFNGDHWRNSGSLSITFALRLHSLIPYSTDSQSIRNLEDQIRAATIGLGQLIMGTEIEVYNIVLALERTRINTQALEQTVALAEQAYRLTEQAYRAGFQDYFQVQNAEQSLRQAHVQLLEQQFTYLNSLIDLEYAIGVPFGTLSSRRINND